MDNKLDDDKNSAADSEAEGALPSNEQAVDEKLIDKKLAEKKWDAARLKGWHGLPWEYRHGKPPEPKAEPWYVWVIILVLAIGILLPLLAWIWGLF